MTMEKAIRYIQIFYRSLMADNSCKENMNTIELDYQAEDFIKVNTQLMLKIFCHESYFLPLNRPINFSFELKHLFVANKVHVEASRYEQPSAIKQKCTNLVAMASLHADHLMFKKEGLFEDRQVV